MVPEDHNQDQQPLPPTTTDNPDTTHAPVHNGQPRAVVVNRDTEGEETAEEGPPVDVIEDDEDLLDDYPEDVEELDLIHQRVLTIPALRLERFRKIQVSPPPFPAPAPAPLTKKLETMSPPKPHLENRRPRLTIPDTHGVGSVR